MTYTYHMYIWHIFKWNVLLFTFVGHFRECKWLEIYISCWLFSLENTNFHFNLKQILNLNLIIIMPAPSVIQSKSNGANKLILPKIATLEILCEWDSKIHFLFTLKTQYCSEKSGKIFFQNYCFQNPGHHHLDYDDYVHDVSYPDYRSRYFTLRKLLNLLGKLTASLIQLLFYLLTLFNLFGNFKFWSLAWKNWCKITFI